MYHWTDSDVGAIIDLVAKSTSSTAGAEEPLPQLLQQLSHLLGADQWMLELGELNLSADSEWDCTKLLVSSEQSLGHFRSANNLRARHARHQVAMNQAEPGTENCQVSISQCSCQPNAPHPIINCFWISPINHTWELEYFRPAGAPGFSERDRAILRVLAGQVEQVACDTACVVSKSHPAQELSPRQREVLELIATGKNGKQIAAELGLSVHTVNDYIKAIYRRYDVSSRAELLAAIHIGAL